MCIWIQFFFQNLNFRDSTSYVTLYTKYPHSLRNYLRSIASNWWNNIFMKESDCIVCKNIYVIYSVFHEWLYRQLQDILVSPNRCSKNIPNIFVQEIQDVVWVSSKFQIDITLERHHEFKLEFRRMSMSYCQILTHNDIHSYAYSFVKHPVYLIWWPGKWYGKKEWSKIKI